MSYMLQSLIIGKHFWKNCLAPIPFFQSINITLEIKCLKKLTAAKAVNVVSDPNVMLLEEMNCFIRYANGFITGCRFSIGNSSPKKYSCITINGPINS